MAAVVVQRFRECQNLLDAVVANIDAIRNLTSQRIAVEEAVRRVGPSAPSDTALRCCSNPLGMLHAFPESTVELIIAQHTEDVNALLRSLSNAQQAWHSKLQQAKEAFRPRLRQDSVEAVAAVSGFPKDASGLDGEANECHAPQVMVGAHALLAVLAQFHGWLQEVILALRVDLMSPTRAVQLSLCLHGYNLRARGADGGIPAASLEDVLGQLTGRVQHEWEACKAQHLVDEAWVMLLS
ncbi:hypothetical protein DQ04_02001060 [Trypanosoma grayi]|uniref:hypothetical protein n=1 Tax=Trypanosoma grayi TaxID=71804 RepID=UPI0004F43697|nr:hypothetical protein DQ04_02001060 [Trypanosoma grayi]KEG12103.1 hypothetical protein DQ04_02001060 [Trypanosoma grayi]